MFSKLLTLCRKNSLSKCGTKDTPYAMTDKSDPLLTVTNPDDLIITTEKDLDTFMQKYQVIGERRTKVVGVTFCNDDGSSRQAILSRCHEGDDIALRYFEYHGDSAYAVYSKHGQIGNLSAELAAEMEDYGDDVYVVGKILEVTGGYHGLSFGCNVALAFYGPKKTLQEQFLETDANDSKDEVPSEPALEAPPAPDVRNEAEEIKTQTTEPSANPATPEIIPTPGNADADTKDASAESQEPDAFDRIRAPETMAHYIVLDIETTGFSRNNDRIIEIAAIHYVFGEEATRFHTFINPQMQIPKHITRLTGIHQYDVDNAPLIEDISDDFLEFIKDYPLVGHNIINFDLPFLEAYIPLGEPHFVIDTLTMARSAFPMLPSHKLSNLNFWFHLNDGDPHRADADAAATNSLMWACLYPDKYASLYRKAVRDGIPKNEHVHSPVAKHRADRICITEVKPSLNQIDRSKPLLGQKIVFTGELSIARKDAMQLAVDAGALLRTSVSSKTDILVVGKQDLSVVGADGMSTKHEKAQEINASGKGSIKIVNEAEFMLMISSVSKSGTNY